MPTASKKSRLLTLGLGITISAAVALVLATGIHAWLMSGNTPTYAIVATPLTLTAADIGPHFEVVHDSGKGPTQDTISPLPYQQQYFGGHLRVLMTDAALSPQGRAEINTWTQSIGIEPTDPPTIIGPFVADHSGIFEVNDAELSYRTTDSAHKDYSCCDYTASRQDNFREYQTIPVQLGDEADAFTGLLIDAPKTEDAYLKKLFAIHWRHGPIVSDVSILGAHDITFDQALRLARIVDQRIAQALQRNAKGAFHAPYTSYVSSPDTSGDAIRLADRSLDRRSSRNLAKY